MFQFPHFLRACPVCGRPLLIRVHYTGRLVTCQHCRGSFMATDPAPPDPAPESLLRRADRLLQRATQRTQGEHPVATN